MTAPPPDPAPASPRALAGGCLAACCALAVQRLLGPTAAEPEVVRAALAVAPGGPTLASARLVLARALGVRADLVSGPLARLLELSGREGLLVLGVDPRALYRGARPGRHAVLLAACRGAGLRAWAAGLLEPTGAGPEDPVAYLDPEGAAPGRWTVPFATLARAFDAAGREALLVTPVRLGPRRARRG